MVTSVRVDLSLSLSLSSTFYINFSSLPFLSLFLSHLLSPSPSPPTRHDNYAISNQLIELVVPFSRHIG